MTEIKRSFKEIVKRFFEPILAEKMVLFLGIIRAINWGISGIIHIVFLQLFTKYLEIGDKDLFLETLYWYGLYIFIYLCIDFLLIGQGWAKIPQTVEKVVLGTYIKKFVRLENTSIEKYGTGKMVAIMNHGLNVWGGLMSQLVEDGIVLTVRIVFAIILLYFQSIYYVPLFLGLLILSQINGVYFNNKAIEYRNKRRDVRNNYISHLVKVLMSKFEVLQTNKYKQEVKSLQTYAEKQIYYNKKYDPFLLFLFQVPFLLLMIIIFVSVYFIGVDIFSGKSQISDFVGVIGMLIMINGNLASFLRLFKNITKEFNEVTKLWDFFDTTPDIKGYDTGNKFKYKTGTISLEDVEFGYSTKQKVFKKFTLEIEGGKVTALVGNSGSGKSTLVKLISGYIRQDAGTITVDDQNLETVSLKSYYKNIGYLTQEPSVFDGTIRDNLMYAVDTGHPQGVTLQKKSCRDTPCRYPELDTVIKQAKCEFIYDLENGLDTEIGEKGIRLSGGQRQRLAIAKIFLKNPKIIILDEPTSALDSFSEEQITKAMHNLFKGRTVIIIAHRLQTVKNADRILVLENGEVSEEGTHRELIKQKGIYKKMLDLQSGF